MTRRIAIFLACVSAVVACSANERPGAAGASSASSSGGPGSSGGTDDGGGTSSGTSGRPNPERLCDLLPQAGLEVGEFTNATDPPPGLGGSIMPGTYALTELEVFVGPQQPLPDGGESPAGGVPTGRAARATLYVTSDAFRFVEARGAPGTLPTADTGRGLTYAKGTQSLDLIPECPTQGAKFSIPYTASGNRLSLLVDATHRENYTRK